MVKKRRRSHAIKKLPAGHAYGSEGRTVTAHGRGSFHEDAEPATDEDLYGYVALWRAVFAQAIMDAKSRRTKKEYDYIRHSALNWLLSNQKDFKTVCEFAGYEPDYLRRRVREAQQRGFIWRAGDGQQPTKHERESRRTELLTMGIGQRQRRRQRHGFVTRFVQLESF